jgi:hypothetical protein
VEKEDFPILVEWFSKLEFWGEYKARALNAEETQVVYGIEDAQRIGTRIKI